MQFIAGHNPIYDYTIHMRSTFHFERAMDKSPVQVALMKPTANCYWLEIRRLRTASLIHRKIFRNMPQMASAAQFWSFLQLYAYRRFILPTKVCCRRTKNKLTKTEGKTIGGSKSKVLQVHQRLEQLTQMIVEYSPMIRRIPDRRLAKIGCRNAHEFFIPRRAQLNQYSSQSPST